MSNATTIAIIGVAGKREQSIATLFAAKYHVLLFGHDQEILSGICHQIRSSGKATDVEAMQCPADASWEADIIILMGYNHADESISKKIKRVATRKIVIVFAAGTGGELLLATSSAWQQLLPYSRLINVLDAGAGAAGELSKQLIMESNDEDALKTGEALFTSVGFNIQTLFTAFNH